MSGTKSITADLPYPEEQDGPFTVYFKDGGEATVAHIDGGGMMLDGDPDADYEVHATLEDGSGQTFLQATIAAVVIVRTGQQVEFGNRYLATHAGHPRGLRGV